MLQLHLLEWNLISNTVTKYLVTSFCSAAQLLTLLCFADGAKIHTAVLRLQVFHSKGPALYFLFGGWIFGFWDLSIVWLSTKNCVDNEGHGLPWTLPVPVHLVMRHVLFGAAVHLGRFELITPADFRVLDHVLSVNWVEKIQKSVFLLQVLHADI